MQESEEIRVVGRKKEVVNQGRTEDASHAHHVSLG
jgi:hypothetical protein